VWILDKSEKRYMKRIWFILTLVIVWRCLSTMQSFSQTAQTSEKTVLPPDMVSYFNGNWAGKGKFSTGKDVRSDVSFVPDLEAQCIVVRQKEKPPNTFEFIALWSMDSVSKDIVMLLASNHNSGARIFRSHGWRDGTIVFQSVAELRALWAFERFTFERETATTFHAIYEFSTDNGKTWQVGDRQTFTKQPSP
jgi:hypothetical protein